MKNLEQMPGPRGLPLLGNLLEVDLSRLHTLLLEWADVHGPVYRFALGNRTFVVLSRPETLHGVLRQRPNVYRRIGTIERVFREMGVYGVFSAEGEEWKGQRRLIAHALDAQHVKRFFPQLREVTQRLSRRWAAGLPEDKGVVQEDLMRFTVDVTTLLAFGYDLNTLQKEGDVIQDHLELIFPMINRRVNAPWPYWRWFRLPSDRALDRAMESVRALVRDCVQKSRERLEADPEVRKKPGHLLEAMLVAAEEGDERFSDEDLFGNVITLLLAGEDTTANTMSWMLYYLADRPELQREIRREVLEWVDAEGVMREEAALEKLAWVEAVAMETMRLKPVAPVLFLEPMQDVELEGYALSAGTSLMLLTMHGGLQEERFGEAKRFRPERWMRGGSESSAAGCPHDVRAFVPFGAGPRFCPGRSLALAEMKMVMAMLSSRFEVIRKEEGPVREKFAFSMMPEGLWLKLRAGERPC